MDSTADAVDAAPGDGICATASPVRCTLRAAVQESNTLPGADTISLPPGTYELAIAGFNQNLAENGDLDLTDSVTIAGAQGAASSTIVDGGTPPPGSPVEVHGLDRLFEVLAEGGSVTFSDLTLREGWAAEYGGAIMNSSSAAITVMRSTLRANGAGKTGGAIDNHFAGSLEVVGSTLSDNYAPEAGSAINNNRGGGLTVTGSVVSSNSAADAGLDENLRGAGAIANNAELDAVGAITVTSSQITDNSAGAGRSGAGISNDGAGFVVIADTVFLRNRALGDGGALFNVNGLMTVARCTFTENNGNNGGAISSTGFGVLDVVESTFSKNLAADWGGALHNGNTGSVSIRSSTIAENAGLNGGGFGNEGSGLVTVESTTFTKNAAIDSATAVGGEGGGMHSNSGGEVVISGGAFTENRALDGGGFSNEGGGQVTMTGTRVASNHADEAGGGILVESGAVRMVGIDVVGNASDSPLEGGGGISYAGDKVVSTGESAAIEGSRIRDNTSKGDGGGIDSRGDGPLAIATTSITGNSALVGGAIHHVGDATLLVTRSTLSGNMAENGGGAFSDGDGEATVENSTISGNRAAQFGGGLLVSSRVTMRNATVSANQAAFGGGINNGGGDFVGDGSVFLANTIVSGNTAGGNCAGTVISRGGNVESGDSCLLRELTDQPGTDPRLGPLADNGGPTRTHALLPASPAQERAVCTELDPCPSVDQRGIARPVFVAVDAGAFESETTPGGGGPTQPCTGRSVRPVNADYDTWISQGTPGANRGTDSILRVGSKQGVNERALVHFTLPPVPPGCKLVAATLSLHSPSATEGRTLEVARLSSDWGEHDVTWANQPAATGSAAVTESGLDRREWSVLAQTLAMYENGAHGFVIRDATEGDAGHQSFHSREKGADRPPELILVFDDPDAPAGGGGSCPTNPQVFFADRDSWVSEGGPANNFGSDSTLKVKSQTGSNARALLHFPLPVLPAACTSVASATLRLDVSSAKDLRTIVVRQSGSSWTENGVTWANQPAAIGHAATLPSGEGILEWAVTPLVLDMYVTANDGFVIADADENGVGDEQTISSRSKINDGAPELVLVLDGTTPETTLGPLPPTSTPDRDATLTFSSDRDDATFECSLDGAAFAPCSTPHALTGLAEGEHRFEVRAKRPVRAVDPTPASATWTVAIPPETTVSGPASPHASADASLSFGADDPEATFECSLDEGPWSVCTSPAELTGLVDGSHELRVRGTDVLGNVEATPAAHVWTVAVPPETAIDSGPPALTNLAFATFTFGAGDNGPADELVFECSLDGAPFASCTSGVLYEELADGTHTFAVRATDPAGHTDQSAAGSSWKVDTTPPETSITTGPPELTNVASASFSLASSEAGSSFACSLDGAAYGACDSGVSYGDLADGRHELSVLATDLAGNEDQSAATYAWTVDTTAPETTIDIGPPTLTNSANASFSLASNEDGSTFACSLDAAAPSACGSSVSYAGLADGGHTLSVTATDEAGNADTSAATWAWTVDTKAPQTSIDSGPPTLANASGAELSFSSTEEHSSFSCSLDGGEYEACESPASYADLADGGHTFSVRATDAAGNTDASEATRTWAIDTVAPETSIGTEPPALSTVADASFAFTSSEEGSTFACSLDSAAFSDCVSPVSYTDLADGAHTFEVVATDAFGNTDGIAATSAWTVDTVAPETSIDLGPPPLTNVADATFLFSSTEDRSSFACSLDSAAFSECESGVSYTSLADGEHVFAVRASDAAGNEDASEATFTWTVDTVAPETTIDTFPPPLSTSTGAEFTFRSSEEASRFDCSLDGEAFASCTSPASYDSLADGGHTFAVRATDAAGNVDANPATYAWRVDATPPETSIAGGPDELTRSTDASFELTSTEPGSTLACSLDGAAFTACTSPVSYDSLVDGGHTFAVRATDAAGNTDPSPAEATWTVDTTAPETSIADSPPAHTNATTAIFAFTSTENDSSFECALDGEAFSECASPATYTGLAESPHTFAVRATDAAGNLDLSAASFAWTVDVTAPETSIATAPKALENTASASFTFSSTEDGSSFACSLDDGAFSECTSPASYDSLGDGGHTFAVRATDAAGNTDATAASHAWTVDTVAPDTAITASPQPITSSSGASFSFDSTEEGATFACALDGSAFAPCTSPASYDGLEDGDYTFSVRATDPAGNTDGTPATNAWTVDTTAPQTAIDSGPPATTTQTSASFELSASETGATFACSLDDADFATCTSPHEVTGLGLGPHELRVRATDAAGNTDATPASYAWAVRAVDATPPQTTLTAGPSGPTNDTTPTFEFEADEPATFECRVDSALFAACGSPHTTAALAQGAHTFEVQATDDAGLTDASPAGASFTVDTTAPGTTISFAPPATTTSQTARFEFDSGETGSSFACSLDHAPFTSCSSPASYTVALGPHTFQVQATDQAGNADATPATHAWTVEDTTAPETTIDSGPFGPTNDSTPTFAFSASENGSTFACSLDSAPFATCTSPVTTGTLANGNHAFEVQATDTAGNTDSTPASRAFTVDTVAPQTTLSSAPPSTTTSRQARFEFGSGEIGSSFDCSLDDAAFASCTSPALYTVGVGPHSFQVRATDAAGNVDGTPASHSWTVQSDPTAPETTIGSGPSGPTPDSTPTFSFSSNETGSTFECSLDHAAFAGCTSPVTTAVLADGPHTFEVRATDVAGNTDASPAARSFTVDTLAPETSITSGPSGPTNDSTPTFAFASTETGSTLQCSVDTAAFTSCSSPFTTSTLSSGAHTFRVRATDPAGNLDQTPDSRSITVDTSAPNTTINTGPTGSTTNRTATFTFSSNDTTATFECSLGSAAFSACTSPATYTVPVGSHQFRVRARDAAGNVDGSPASRNWTVTADTTAPQTTITSGTSGTTSNPVATFHFTSNETGSTFDCSLDSAAFSSCTSPASYTVAPGPHTFQVRARDSAGNVDGSPASSSWTLDTTAPDTTIGEKPSSPTTDTVATFTFASTETGSTFECSLDGAGFASCSSPVSYTVPVGSHTFQARARDAAGNLDGSPASHAWTVEAPPEGSCASPGTVTLGASADSWILESSPTSNYGSDSVLKVDSKSGGNARALVRFALPPIPAGCQVVDADLRLYAGSNKPGRTLQAFALTGSWTESGVTWSSQPATVGAAATTASGSGYVEWNVISQLAATYGTNTGFLVRDQTEGGAGVEQGYNSREKGADNPPRLVVTFG